MRIEEKKVKIQVCHHVIAEFVSKDEELGRTLGALLMSLGRNNVLV